MINAPHFEDTYQIKRFEPKIFLFSYSLSRAPHKKLWPKVSFKILMMFFCFALVLLLCMAPLLPNLQTVPNLKAGTVPGGKTVSTFGKTFLRQLSKSSLFLIKSDWHEFFPNTSIAMLLLYSCQLTHMRGHYQFRNLTTFVLKHVVIPWSQIHLPNAHVSEESLTETFCDFLSWSTTPSTWKRRVHSFTPAFNLENIQIRK